MWSLTVDLDERRSASVIERKAVLRKSLIG
jgi:hypothetical protein